MSITNFFVLACKRTSLLVCILDYKSSYFHLFLGEFAAWMTYQTRLIWDWEKGFYREKYLIPLDLQSVELLEWALRSALGRKIISLHAFGFRLMKLSSVSAKYIWVLGSIVTASCLLSALNLKHAMFILPPGVEGHILNSNHINTNQCTNYGMTIIVNFWFATKVQHYDTLKVNSYLTVVKQFCKFFQNGFHSLRGFGPSL